MKFEVPDDEEDTDNEFDPNNEIGPALFQSVRSEPERSPSPRIHTPIPRPNTGRAMFLDFQDPSLFRRSIGLPTTLSPIESLPSDTSDPQRLTMDVPKQLQQRITEACEGPTGDATLASYHQSLALLQRHDLLTPVQPQLSRIMSNKNSSTTQSGLPLMLSVKDKMQKRRLRLKRERSNDDSVFGELSILSLDDAASEQGAGSDTPPTTLPQNDLDDPPELHIPGSFRSSLTLKPPSQGAENCSEANANDVASYSFTLNPFSNSRSTRATIQERSRTETPDTVTVDRSHNESEAQSDTQAEDDTQIFHDAHNDLSGLSQVSTRSHQNDHDSIRSNAHLKCLVDNIDLAVRLDTAEEMFFQARRREFLRTKKVEAAQQVRYDSLKRENIRLSEEIVKLHQENYRLRQQITPANREVQSYTQILRQVREVLKHNYLTYRINHRKLMDLEERTSENFANFLKIRNEHPVENQCKPEEASEIRQAIADNQRDSEIFQFLFDNAMRASIEAPPRMR